ncbi:MAG: hypothetical protein A2046_14130 [Bacteroidetes bacterium GWA2_30_7]|nr:MAG: hypothetical protein A2046_14130 [Bacteroidetes bacterium GWA2_30_7]
MENQIENQSGSVKLRPAPKSIAAMVLGISSLGSSIIYGIFGIPCGILAIIFAVKARNAYEKNPSIYTPGSQKMIKTGMITGIIGLILSVIILVAVIFFFVWIFNQSSHYNDYDYSNYSDDLNIKLQYIKLFL